MFFAIFLLLFGLQSNASIKRFQYESDTLRIAELYSEAGSWNIDVFRINTGKMQVLEKRHKSQRKEIIDRIWQKKYQGWESQDPSIRTYLNTESRSQVLWAVHNDWDEQWERKFYDWVDSEFDKNFFAKYEIATDCADAAIALRWIFSRMHGLPAGNHLAGSGILMTQDSVRQSWLDLPTAAQWHEDERFRAALDYLADNAYTHTLFRDTYPVAITRKSMRAGTIFIELHGTTGHTRIISETHYDDPSRFPAVLLSSTVPRTIRSLYEEPFIGLSAAVPNKSGLRQMRWIVNNGAGWEMVQEESGLYYSMEQYDPSYQPNFTGRVYEVLNVQIDPKVIAGSVVGDLKQSIDDRIRVVNEGFTFCETADCSLGTPAWEDWSTPSRDKRFVDKVSRFWTIMRHIGNSEVSQWVEGQFDHPWWEIEGAKLNLRKVQYLLKEKLASSNPEVNIARRWGASPTAIAQNLHDRFLDLWLKRIKLSPETEGAACKTYCHIASEDFRRKNTLELDLRLRELVLTKYSMKEGLGAEIESLVGDELSRLEVMPYRFSMDEALKRIPMLSSDPNAPGVDRWAMNPSAYHIFRRSEASNFAVVGPWVLYGQSFSRLGEGATLREGAIISNPYSQIYPFLVQNFENNKIEAFDAERAEWRLFEPGLEFFNATMLVGKLGLMWTFEGVHLFEIAGNELVVRETFDWAHKMSLAKDLFFVKKDGKKFVFSLQNGRIKRLEVDVDDNLSVSDWKTSSTWLYQTLPNSVKLIHSKRGGKVLNFKLSGSFWESRFISDNVLALTGNSTLLIYFRDDGTVLWQQELPGYFGSNAFYEDKLYILVYHERPVLFRVEKDGVREVPNQPGHFFAGLGNDYVLSYNSESRSFYLQRSPNGAKRKLPQGYGYQMSKGIRGDDRVNAQLLDPVTADTPALVFQPDQLWSGRALIDYSYSFYSLLESPLLFGQNQHIDRGQILPFGPGTYIWTEFPSRKNR